MTDHAEQEHFKKLEHFKKVMEPTPRERCLYEDDWDGLMVVNCDGTFADMLNEILEENNE